MLAIYEFIPKFNYIRGLRNQKINRFKTDEVKRYLEEFSKGENQQLENVKRIEFLLNLRELTMEQHIHEANKLFYKNLAETNALSRKELRYPI
ncbi:hypothetical protein JNUCC1_03068 [Lentibacillus sp. JNUCC-1]|uniref:hypothetical protein n=1 Tax=Lentibacillus sp. JNUCC-1 TaxID=2654513 RepID=UPI00132B8A93|nr:hypothetical protein [Lentibacillus sp. JNUCC-1]MUV39195.1 hypothetical protein [Lentibacillus sp. JNUCC-1]